MKNRTSVKENSAKFESNPNYKNETKFEWNPNNKNENKF